jgi:hypothetical protein
MKTSNKTKRRFLGIAVVMMVLSLVSGNLVAQKSYNENSLAVLSSEFFANINFEIMHAIPMSNINDEEPLEDWMMTPAIWNTNETLPVEVDFEEKEMILEDWMMKTNWEDNSLLEEELQMEDWMTKTNWQDNSLYEEVLQMEDWMTNSTSWN